MTLEEAIEKVGENWQTGIKGYFTADEICDLEETEEIYIYCE